MEGWVKLHRALLEWEWYDDINVKVLFIHILLKCNHKDKTWRGVDIKKGSFMTGRKALSKETGLTEQQVRTSLNKLKSTNEITIKSTNLNSFISVVKWNSYQLDNQPNDNWQPTSNQQVTTTKNVKKENNVNNDKNTIGGKPSVFSFNQSLISIGVEKENAAEWIKQRNKARAANTEKAFKQIENQIKLSGRSANDCVEICLGYKERSGKVWTGFKADWINNLQQSNNINNGSITGKETRTEEAKRTFLDDVAALQNSQSNEGIISND